MTAIKHKIIVVEDDYRQFQICRDSLKAYFEILPNVDSKNKFNCITSKLMRFLEKNDVSYINEFDNYKDISAFIVDYELKEDSNKTGVLFCQSTEIIRNGGIPVLFLTKIGESEPTNRISKLKETNPEINYDFLRKPEIWADEDNKIESIVGKSNNFSGDVKNKIEKLIDKNKKASLSDDEFKKIESL